MCDDWFKYEYFVETNTVDGHVFHWPSDFTLRIQIQFISFFSWIVFGFTWIHFLPFKILCVCYIASWFLPIWIIIFLISQFIRCLCLFSLRFKDEHFFRIFKLESSWTLANVNKSCYIITDKILRTPDYFAFKREMQIKIQIHIRFWNFSFSCFRWWFSSQFQKEFYFPRIDKINEGRADDNYFYL